MWIVLSTMVLYAAIESVTVGLSLASLSRRFNVRLSTLASIPILLPVFALLAVYYIPAVEALDAKLIVGNQDIAKEIGPGSPIVVRELFRIGITDPLVWLIQGSIASIVARWALREA